ncbi:hypothetical protein [Saccharopolyspora dendranthemae]|uniref:Histone H1-like nucleoprotein HC2 n=1 Tax=Saccharopolyspora dendranthemae TaxID=1181886 RepID=A0A561V8A3_9PSEU|nr:hypothetical protein [Saccharopolyspora dendranthemae]TWG07841.1 hypothetical protein FHU35_11460 [Saccharopolyspora dendranthemae]
MSKAQIATAVAVGYALGRTRRMKLALMAGGVLVGRRVKSPTDLLAKAGSSVPTELTGTLRDRLVDAARSAAVSAASGKIDSLGDDLSERAAKIRAGKDEPDDQHAEQDESEDQPAESGDRQEESNDQPAESDGRKPASSQRSETQDAPARAPRKPSAPRKPRAASTRKAGGNDG